MLVLSELVIGQSVCASGEQMVQVHPREMINYFTSTFTFSIDFAIFMFCICWYIDKYILLVRKWLFGFLPLRSKLWFLLLWFSAVSDCQNCANSIDFNRWPFQPKSCLKLMTSVRFFCSSSVLLWNFCCLPTAKFSRKARSSFSVMISSIGVACIESRFHAPDRRKPFCRMSVVRSELIWQLWGFSNETVHVNPFGLNVSKLFSRLPVAILICPLTTRWLISST